MFNNVVFNHMISCKTKSFWKYYEFILLKRNFSFSTIFIILLSQVLNFNSPLLSITNPENMLCLIIIELTLMRCNALFLYCLLGSIHQWFSLRILFSFIVLLKINLVKIERKRNKMLNQIKKKFSYNRR
jgi:hypothetical protein